MSPHALLLLAGAVAVLLGVGYVVSWVWGLFTRRRLRVNMLAHDCDMDMARLDEGDPDAIYGEYPPEKIEREVILRHRDTDSFILRAGIAGEDELDWAANLADLLRQHPEAIWYGANSLTAVERGEAAPTAIPHPREDRMNANNPLEEWRIKLDRSVLTDKDMLLIEDQLGMKLYGMRKEDESIVGFRILHENDGYADMLLMRRDFANGGFFFDLDITLGHITEAESTQLRQQVESVVGQLTEKAQTQ